MEDLAIFGGILTLILTIAAVILAVVWLFLPFIIISKLNSIREAVENFHDALAKAMNRPETSQ